MSLNFISRILPYSARSISGSSKMMSGGKGVVDYAKKKRELDSEFEEEEAEFASYVRSVRKIERKEESDMLHGIEGDMIYKYDLPVINLPFKLRNSQLMVQEEEKEALTQVEKLFEILECDKDTAYESFVIKFNQKYNHEVDMYGSIRKAGEVDLRVLDFGVPIPHTYLENQ
jgi:hypothetical protein